MDMYRELNYNDALYYILSCVLTEGTYFKLEELISCIIDICVCLVGHDVTIELSINNIQPDSCNYTVELAMC